VADSWRYGTTFVNFQIYFAFVDFDEASDVFNYVCRLTVLINSYLEQEPEKLRTLCICSLKLIFFSIFCFTRNAVLQVFRVIHGHLEYQVVLIQQLIFIFLLVLCSNAVLPCSVIKLCLCGQTYFFRCLKSMQEFWHHDN